MAKLAPTVKYVTIGGKRFQLYGIETYFYPYPNCTHNGGFYFTLKGGFHA